MTTPKTGAPELVESQADKEETVNEMGRRIESGAGHFRVEDRNLTAPPGACADGATYIISGPSPTGAWANEDGNIAIAVGTNASNGWYIIDAEDGMTAWVKDESVKVRFDNTTSPSSWILDNSAIGTLALDDLSDVDVPSPSDGQVLTFDTDSPQGWKAMTPAGTTFATSGEIDTGTEAAKAVSPDALAGSNFGKRVMSVLVSDPAGDDITTGDGKAYVRIPATLNGMNLVDLPAAALDTAGTGGGLLVQLRRKRAGADVDMLSTRISIDSGQNDSAGAATPPAINGSNDDVATGDRIYIDLDGVPTGAKGLTVEMTFQLP